MESINCLVIHIHQHIYELVHFKICELNFVNLALRGPNRFFFLLKVQVTLINMKHYSRLLNKTFKKVLDICK